MYIISSPERSAFESINYQSVKQDKIQFRWQSNNDYTLIYIIRGQGRRFVGDSMEDFTVDDFVLIPPGMPFAYVSDYEYFSGGVEYISIRFNPEFAGAKFFNIPEMSRCSGLLKRADHGVLINEVPETLKSVIREMENMNRLNRLLTFLTILDSLGELPVEILASDTYTPCTSRDDMERIQEVCLYINSNYEKNLSAEQLGEIINMSPPSFCRFFKRVMNKTFHRYLCEIRIALAKRLLENTELLTEDVGKRCGFRTIPGFTARFKDLTEHTPAAFRRAAKVK